MLLKPRGNGHDMNTATDVATSEKSKPHRNFLFLRGMGIFLLFALLLGGLYWLCLHHYKDVAEWSGTGDDLRASLQYEDQTYYLAAKLGSPGVSAGDYVKGDALGEVKPDGRDALTRAYPVYAVTTKEGAVREGYLIVIYEDEATGEDASFVYYAEGLENPYLGERDDETETDTETDTETETEPETDTGTGTDTDTDTETDTGEATT